MHQRSRASKPGVPKSPGHAMAHQGQRNSRGIGMRPRHPGAGGPQATPPPVAGQQSPQIASQGGPQAMAQNLLGQQASMQRIAALQKQMGIPATPQGQV